MAEEQSFMDRVIESWKEAQAERFQEFKGQGMAMIREGIEDSRNAIMGEWAGGPSAMGTPLHPTPQMIHEEQTGTYEQQLASVHGQSMPEDPGVGVQTPEQTDVGVQQPETQAPEQPQVEVPQAEVKQPEMEMEM